MADLPLHSHSPSCSGGNPCCDVIQEKGKSFGRFKAALDPSLTVVDHTSSVVIPALAQLPMVKALRAPLSCGRSEVAHCGTGWLIFSMRPAHIES